MKSWISMLAASLLFTACEKEKEEPEMETTCLEGSIQWGGDPAADGSGWTFVAAETNQQYFLSNLQQAYKQDDLAVAVCLEKTNYHAICECPNAPFVYEIISIQKK